MFKDSHALTKYIVENYTEVSKERLDASHWALECSTCRVKCGFQLVALDGYGEQAEYGRFRKEFKAPLAYLFRCPACSEFKVWIVYERSLQAADGRWNTRYFRVTAIPSEGLEDIEELPADPPGLRIAYKQAIRAMDANANIAAAAMFRRALQVITREVLGAKPGNLANELKEIIGKTYGSVTITADFTAVASIVKEAGNQGAHPDKDPDLLDFTAEDMHDLQNIFMELVSELFIVPAAARKARIEFATRRKIGAAEAQ
jgi:hypothetical protein